MSNDLTVVVGHTAFYFHDLVLASAARDWAARNSIRVGEFRAQYPEIPSREISSLNAVSSQSVQSTAER